MGKYFDEFELEQEFTTPRRTITNADIMNFAGVTGDFNPVHTDDVFASAGPFGERIAHGPMLVGMSFGLLSRIDLLDGTIVALRNITWSFEGPVRIGDTVHVRASVEKHRLSKSMPDRGFVQFALDVINQKNDVVQKGTAGVILMKAK